MAQERLHLVGNRAHVQRVTRTAAMAGTAEERSTDCSRREVASCVGRHCTRMLCDWQVAMCSWQATGILKEVHNIRTLAETKDAPAAPHRTIAPVHDARAQMLAPLRDARTQRRRGASCDRHVESHAAVFFIVVLTGFDALMSLGHRCKRKRRPRGHGNSPVCCRRCRAADRFVWRHGSVSAPAQLFSSEQFEFATVTYMHR